MNYLKVLVLVFLLASCSQVMKLLGGGGPQFNTNAQIGKTNTQQLVANQTNSTISTGKNSIVTKTDNKVATGSVDKIVVNEGIPVNLFLLAVLVGLIGWILPTPSNMGLWFIGLFRRK